jgi:hypothetical protein
MGRASIRSRWGFTRREPRVPPRQWCVAEFNKYRAKYNAVLRTPTFLDNDMTYRLPPGSRSPNELWDTDRVCKDPQLMPNQTIGSPSLTARAGDSLLLMYQENGHVTKLDQDPGHSASGSVRVIGTLRPSPADSLQAMSSVSNSDEVYELLFEGNFDDGVCYQDNGSMIAQKRKSVALRRPRLASEGPDVWCGTRITLPATLQPYTAFTLYWIWNFDGRDFVERYTTCLDIFIV